MWLSAVSVQMSYKVKTFYHRLFILHNFKDNHIFIFLVSCVLLIRAAQTKDDSARDRTLSKLSTE